MAVRDVVRQMSEITNTTINHNDVVATLRQMEADGGECCGAELFDFLFIFSLSSSQ